MKTLAPWRPVNLLWPGLNAVSAAASVVTAILLLRLIPRMVPSKNSSAGRSPLQNPRDALHASEERFRLLVDAVSDYALLMLDPSGNVVSWNTGAERIKGYKADEIIGRHFSCFICLRPLPEAIPKRNCGSPPQRDATQKKAGGSAKTGRAS